VQKLAFEKKTLWRLQEIWGSKEWLGPEGCERNKILKWYGHAKGKIG
jgi:hypothetical protein